MSHAELEEKVEEMKDGQRIDLNSIFNRKWIGYILETELTLPDNQTSEVMLNDQIFVDKLIFMRFNF